MPHRVHQQPTYQWLRQYLKDHGAELRKRYGAHGVGIGRKITGGQPTDQLALRFYVERKRAPAELGEHTIPERISFKPEGEEEAVELLTDVIESPPAEFEEEPG